MEEDYKNLINDICVFRCEYTDSCCEDCEEIKQLKNLLTRYKQMEAELEKKEAIINEMSIYINSPLRIPEEKYCEFYNSDDDCCWKTDKECKDCIKEYFTKKVEGK